MNSLKRNTAFKIISLVLVVAFMNMNVAWAYPELKATTHNLVPQTVNNPIEMPEGVADASKDLMGLLLSAGHIGKYLLGEEAHLSEDNHRLIVESLRQVMSLEIPEALREGIMLKNVVTAEYLEQELPGKLQDILRQVGLEDVIPSKDVVFIPCEKEGKEVLLVVTRKDKVKESDISAHKWDVYDDLAINIIPEYFSVAGFDSDYTSDFGKWCKAVADDDKEAKKEIYGKYGNDVQRIKEFIFSNSEKVDSPTDLQEGDIISYAIEDAEYKGEEIILVCKVLRGGVYIELATMIADKMSVSVFAFGDGGTWKPDFENDDIYLVMTAETDENKDTPPASDARTKSIKPQGAEEDKTAKTAKDEGSANPEPAMIDKAKEADAYIQRAIERITPGFVAVGHARANDQDRIKRVYKRAGEGIFDEEAIEFFKDVLKPTYHWHGYKDRVYYMRFLKDLALSGRLDEEGVRAVVEILTSMLDPQKEPEYDSRYAAAMFLWELNAVPMDKVEKKILDRWGITKKEEGKKQREEDKPSSTSGGYGEIELLVAVVTGTFAYALGSVLSTPTLLITVATLAAILSHSLSERFIYNKQKAVSENMILLPAEAGGENKLLDYMNWHSQVDHMTWTGLYGQFFDELVRRPAITVDTHDFSLPNKDIGLIPTEMPFKKEGMLNAVEAAVERLKDKKEITREDILKELEKEGLLSPEWREFDNERQLADVVVGAVFKGIGEAKIAKRAAKTPGSSIAPSILSLVLVLLVPLFVGCASVSSRGSYGKTRSIAADGRPAALKSIAEVEKRMFPAHIERRASQTVRAKIEAPETAEESEEEKEVEKLLSKVNGKFRFISTRINAIGRLGEIANASAIDPLIELILKENDLRSPHAAVALGNNSSGKSLIEKASEEQIKKLLDFMKGTTGKEDLQAKFNLLGTLRRMAKDREDVKDVLKLDDLVQLNIWKLGAHPRSNPRWGENCKWAAYRLAKLKDPRAIPALKAAYEYWYDDPVAQDAFENAAWYIKEAQKGRVHEISINRKGHIIIEEIEVKNKVTVDGQVIGQYTPFGDITIDFEKARKTLTLAGLEDHKITAFVHAHEILHQILLVAAINLHWTYEAEEALADAFAKNALGMKLSDMESDLLILAMRKIKRSGYHQTALRQFKLSYDDPEFLLNLRKILLRDIDNISNEKIEGKKRTEARTEAPEKRAISINNQGNFLKWKWGKPVARRAAGSYFGFLALATIIGLVTFLVNLLPWTDARAEDTTGPEKKPESSHTLNKENETKLLESFESGYPWLAEESLNLEGLTVQELYMAARIIQLKRNTGRGKLSDKETEEMLKRIAQIASRKKLESENREEKGEADRMEDVPGRESFLKGMDLTVEAPSTFLGWTYGPYLEFYESLDLLAMYPEGKDSDYRLMFRRDTGHILVVNPTEEGLEEGELKPGDEAYEEISERLARLILVLANGDLWETKKLDDTRIRIIEDITSLVKARDRERERKEKEAEEARKKEKRRSAFQNRQMEDMLFQTLENNLKNGVKVDPSFLETCRNINPERYKKVMSKGSKAKNKIITNGKVIGRYEDGEIVIDFEKARKVLRVLGLNDYEITAFVHAHEIFHQIMDKTNVLLSDTYEERLADAFAKKVMNLPLSWEEATILNAVQHLVPQGIARQFDISYDSPEFLLNLNRVLDNIYNVSDEKLDNAIVEDAATAGAKFMGKRSSKTPSMPEALEKLGKKEGWQISQSGSMENTGWTTTGAGVKNEDGKIRANLQLNEEFQEVRFGVDSLVSLVWSKSASSLEVTHFPPTQKESGLFLSPPRRTQAFTISRVTKQPVVTVKYDRRNRKLHVYLRDVIIKKMKKEGFSQWEETESLEEEPMTLCILPASELNKKKPKKAKYMTVKKENSPEPVSTKPLLDLVKGTINNNRSRLIDAAKTLAEYISTQGDVLSAAVRMLDLDEDMSAADIKYDIEQLMNMADHHLFGETDIPEEDLEEKLEVLPEEARKAYKYIYENLHRLDTDDMIANIIVLARKAARENESLIIGIEETGWIPGYDQEKTFQQMALNPLMREIESIEKKLKELGLDNVVLVHSDSQNLARELINKAEETDTSSSNMVILGSGETLMESESFAPLRNAPQHARPFMACVDSSELKLFYKEHGESLENQTYVPITEMLSITLELANGKTIKEDLPIIVSYDKAKRIVVFLPKPEKVDYNKLKKRYEAKLQALRSL